MTAPAPELRPDPERAERAQRFYGRHARLYDLIARYVPGVRTVRRRMIDRLGIGPGDTVLEVGCGTGANLALIRDRVGSRGRVVGIDFTPEVLAIAREHIRREEWANVSVARGDATAPPVDAVDALLASFVVGMLPDPAATVEQWMRLVGPTGRIGLLDAAPSRGRGSVLNPAFALVVWAGTPPGARGQRDPPPSVALATRVGDAHDRLRRRTVDPVVERPVLGFVWITAGSPAEGP